MIGASISVRPSDRSSEGRYVLDAASSDAGLPFFKGGQDGGEAWRDEGLCLNLSTHDPDLAGCFFSDAVARQRRAKALCKQCPVTEECGNYGLREVTGIWGGLGVRERQRLVARDRVGSRSVA